MENAILLYLIKVSVALLVFSTAYFLLFRRDTFMKARRLYFIFTLFFTLLYPLLVIELPVRGDTAHIPSYWLSQVEIGTSDVANEEQPFSLLDILLIGSGIVSVLLLIRLLVQLGSVIRLRLINDSEKRFGYRLIKIQEKDAPPFSFFKWIFIDSHYSDSTVLSGIMLHEEVHVRQWHSLDVLLFELFCICFWWNPLAWILRREMKINLEYLADKGVLDKGSDWREYQYALLQVSAYENEIPIINNFNVSQLKRRITMMNKEKTSLAKAAKYLAILPVSFVLLLGNAVQASTNLADITSTLSDVDNIAIQYDDTIASDIKSLSLTGKVVAVAELKKEDDIPQSKVKPFVTVEAMPSYPGGESAMIDYLKRNLKYPEEAKKKGVQGRVTLRFVVNDDGKIGDVTVIRGLAPDCDTEAVRVVSSMPNWVPGKQNGVAVPVYFTLPIVFRSRTDNMETVSNDASIPKAVLVVLDGVIIDRDKIDSIDTSTIENVSVLKGAEAIAKYGDAGKNGVIIMTSKK